MLPAPVRLLLRVLPRDFRDEFGSELEEVLEAQWAEVRDTGGIWQRTRFWWRQCAAVGRAAAQLRRDEKGRRGGGGGIMEGLLQDLRHSLRSLGKRPGFALVAIGTLGLGIGAATSMFSSVRTVLLRPLPYTNAERVVALFQVDQDAREPGTGISAANIRDMDQSATLLSGASVAEPWSLDLAQEGRTETLRTWAVSVGFFDILGAQPVLGRHFTADEYEEGNDKVVVLGHRSWVARFGSDPDLVGQALNLDGEAYVVVGVLGEAFRFPDRAEAWIPRPPREWDGQSRTADFMTGIGLMAPGVTLAQAQAEADRLASALAEAYPETNTSMGLELVPLTEHLLGDVRSPLLLLLAAVGAVLLIACANVAGLMLARGAQRQREFALRAALGAGGYRLVRHVTLESLLLAVGGCALGVALTYGGLEVVRGLAADQLPRIDELRVDGQVLAFAAAIGALSAVLAGIAPSLRLSRPEVRDILSEGSRGTLGARGGNRLRRRLVVAEIAGAVVLVVGAGLLMKSFAQLVNRDLGFEPRDRVAVQVFAYDYGSVEEKWAFFDEALRQMEAVPGVRDVALTSNLPGATDGTVASIDFEVSFTVVDRAAPPVGQEPTASMTWVSPGLFEVLEIPVVSGRSFAEADNAQAPRVAVVNEAFARRHVPGEDPLGQRVAFEVYGQEAEAEIVGVVRDVRPMGHQSEPRPEIYLSLSQASNASVTFVAAVDGDAASRVRPLTEAIWAANPAQSVWGAATLESLLDDWLRERRFYLYLLGAFGGVALLLAAVGIYGLISYSVEQRVGELGVRRALGGQTGDLMRLVLREGAVLASGGIVLGLVAAALLSRFLQGMLLEVEGTDPATYATLAALVLVVATAAVLVPAIRAVRVDPMKALRAD